MTNANQLILEGGIRHAHWLERYNKGVVSRIIALLNKSDKDLAEQIAARLATIEGRGYNLSKAETARLEKLLDDIRAKRVELYKLMHDETINELSELAIHEADFQKSLIEHSVSAIGKTVQLASPPLTLLRSVAVSRPFQGRLLKDWYEALPAQAGNRIADAIKIGIVQGQTTDQIVRRVVGTRALQYKDGILQINRHDATSIVRTAVAHTANNASEELYAANADIVMGVQIVATLDGRTTALCASLDGKIYPIGEGRRPPFHWGCRTTTIPYLGEEYSGTRASINGQVSARMTYGEWLAKQKPSVQDEILGNARGKLFRDGGLKIDRFTDVTGRNYTLQELKNKDAESFEKAFGRKEAESPDVQKAKLSNYLGEKTYGRFNNYVSDAMERNNTPDYDLSEAEKVALYAYTSGERYYVRLNNALRSDKAADIARVSDFADVLDGALAKLPKHDGFVTRNTDLPLDIAEKMKVGKTYSDPAYMSTSMDIEPPNFNGAYDFTIMARGGRKISGFSQFPDESEVLFPRASKFDILKVTEKDGKFTVIMDEIDG